MILSFGLFGPSKSDENPPWLLHYRSSKWFILLTISLAVFTDIFLYAVIVPVIPFALNSRAQIKDEDVQSWVAILIAVYGGALAISSPLCGWLADHTSSRRLPLVLGLIALGASTVLLNFGPNIAALIMGRILQGISAAVVWCVGLALLADTVERDEIGQTMGYVFTAMSLGVLLGPLLGGVVFEKGGYNDVYAMAYILIGIDIALRLLMIEKKVAKKWEKTVFVESESRREDNTEKSIEVAEKTNIPGIDASRGTTPKDSHSQGPASGSTSDPTSTTQTHQTTTPTKQSRFPPVITLLKSRRLLSALWGTLTVAILMTQFDSVLPIYVRKTFNWTSTGAGLIFLPLVLPSLLAPLIGRAMDRYGVRWFALLGFLTLTPFEILLRLVHENNLHQKVLLCALLALIGFTLNLCTPPLMVEITSVVEEKERKDPGLFGERGAYAQAYGLFNLAWAGGCLVGPIWAGFVNERAGWGTMAWTLALLSAVTAVPAGVWTGGYAFKKNRLRWRDRFDDDRGCDVESVR